MSLPAPDAAPSLHRYGLIAEIGRGGMADVFLAVMQGPAGFNKLVVLKKARRDLSLDADHLAMFLDEARLAARMNHPNVVQTHEIGQDGDELVISMEYLDGQPYSRVASRLRGDLPLALHARVIADALAGLHHAHELRDFDGTPLLVVHRDVSPQNVFVTYDGSIKVVDFGIAKALDSSARTGTGVVKGKIVYMSPEQARGDPLDRRADVFAAGVMLWEAIARRRMWGELPDVSAMHQLLHVGTPSIRDAMPSVPPALARVCDRALALEREERYPTALEMQRELEDYLAAAGERSSARDVGEVVAMAFETERRRVQSVIESQLRDVRWTGAHARPTRDLPSIDMIMGPPVVEPPAPPDVAPAGISVTPALPVAAGAPHALVPTNGGASVSMPAPPPRRSLLVPALVGAIACVVVVAAGVQLVMPSAGPAPVPAASSIPSVAPPPAPTEAAPEMVTLTIRVTPEKARVYLDGVLISTGPFTGKVKSSAAPRVLRLEAERYAPREELVSIGADLTLSFDLEAEERGSPASSGHPSTGRPPRSKRDIDSNSPY